MICRKLLFLYFIHSLCWCSLAADSLEKEHTRVGLPKVILKAPLAEYAHIIREPFRTEHLEDFLYYVVESNFNEITPLSLHSWLEKYYPEEFKKLKEKEAEEILLRERSRLVVDTTDSSNPFLKDYLGNKIITYKGRYVMDSRGNCYISNSYITGLIAAHTSFLKAEFAAGAGEICIANGKVTYIDNESGHYLPLPYHLYQTIKFLEQQKLVSADFTTKVLFPGRPDQREFNSLESFYRANCHELSDSEMQKFQAEETQMFDPIKTFLELLKNPTILRPRQQVLRHHYAKFQTHYKFVEGELRNILWTGYMHMLLPSIYRGIYTFSFTPRDYNYYDGYPPHNSSYYINLASSEESVLQSAMQRFLLTYECEVFLCALGGNSTAELIKEFDGNPAMFRFMSHMTDAVVEACKNNDKKKKHLENDEMCSLASP